MNKSKLVLTAAAFALAGSSAYADDTLAVNYALTGSNNYIFRGVSQTSNDPAAFGLVKLTYGQFYATAGGETVDFHNSIDAEYDLAAGWTPSYDDFNFNLGIIRYGYIDEPHHQIDTVELKGGVSRTFDQLTLGALVAYAPDYFGTSGEGTYFEGNAAYAITDKLSLSGAAGEQTIDKGTDYTTWNAGASYAFTNNIAVDLRYYDTDKHAFGSNYNSHFVAALKLSF